MQKQVYYKYLGTNGVIVSPVHLEDTYYVRLIKLTPEDGKKITKDGINSYAMKLVPEEEVSDWFEVPAGQDESN